MKLFLTNWKKPGMYATAFLLLVALSCKKETLPVKTETEPEKNGTNNEAVITSATTSLSLNLAPRSSASDGVPIVLVHGLFGFGRDEMLGLKYFGGPIYDVQEELKNKGYSVFTASMGPVSSNFDRAIELYYQIKGGTVDYGKFHSAKMGHSQKVGKTYPGFYPQWDANHPIHLIGHSMGGQTERVLVALLENGVPEEKTDPNHASIFDGSRKGWVKSVTTISTPHKGTSGLDVMGSLATFIKNAIISAATIANPTGIEKALYDFDLEQWGIVRNPGEALSSYINRVMASKIWSTNDQGAYDLNSTGGAESVNNFAKDASDVYYFSYGGRANNTGVLTGWEYPKLTMLPVLAVVAYPYAWPLKPGMGNYTRNTTGLTVIDRTWWQNDGIVNLVSSRCPTGSLSVTYNSSTTLTKGVWNVMPTLNGYDHLDVVGWGNYIDVRPLYLNHAEFISHLP